MPRARASSSSPAPRAPAVRARSPPGADAASGGVPVAPGVVRATATATVVYELD